MSHFKSRLIKLFLLLVIVSSVASAEFPELSKLTDDTSNDFAVLSITPVEIRIEASVPAARRHGVASYIPREQASDGPQLVVFRGSGDTLALLTTLRT